MGDHEHQVPRVNRAMKTKAALVCFIIFFFVIYKKNKNKNNKGNQIQIGTYFMGGSDTSPWLIRKLKVSVALVTEAGRPGGGRWGQGCLPACSREEGETVTHSTNQRKLPVPPRLS